MNNFEKTLLSIIPDYIVTRLIYKEKIQHFILPSDITRIGKSYKSLYSVWFSRDDYGMVIYNDGYCHFSNVDIHSDYSFRAPTNRNWTQDLLNVGYSMGNAIMAVNIWRKLDDLENSF